MTVVVTGTEILRQAVRSRKMGLAGVARELNVSTHSLESFLAGGSLPVEVCNAIAAFVFGDGVTYDPASDRLRSLLRPEPQAFGISPEPFKRIPLSDVVGPPRPPPKSTAKPQPAWPRRAGWAE